MAITLRQTAIDTGGKATELNYQEMNNNLKSYYYSSSLTGNVLDLHFLSGSTSHSIDLSSISSTDTNIGNTNLTLSGNRTLNLSTYNYSIDALQGNNITYAIENTGDFTIALADSSTVHITGLANTTVPNILGYNSSTGEISYYSTASFNGGGSTDYVENVTFNGTVLDFTGVGLATSNNINLSSVTGSSVQPSQTGSLYYSSSVNLNTITFYQGDGTTESVTVNTGSSVQSINVTRPGSDDQNITFIEILANQQAAWNIQSTSGATPTSTNVTTDSATVSSITALKIHHTADTTGSFTGDVATALDQLAYGGTVQIGDTGEPTNTATATVRQVVDNGTYHTIYTSAWNSSGLTTLSGVFGLLIGFDTDKVVVLDDKNYNRIKVNNDCGNSIGLRFKANPAASPGDYYYVEVTADSANTDNMLFEYIHNTSGTGASYVESTNNIYYHNNAATLTQLNVNSTYQQAVVEFRVTPSGNLALMGADKVLR